MPRIRSLTASALAVLPVMALAPHLGAQSIRHQARPVSASWALAVTRHFGQPGNASGYSAILAAGDSLWVFGGTNPGGGSGPVIEVLAGRHWVASSLPGGLTGFLSDASAPGPRDIWAISGYSRYVLHWDGSRWRLLRSWRDHGTLSGVVATGPRNAWVFGTTADGVSSLGTWHYYRRHWHRAGGLARDIYAASAVSGRDIWAVAAGPRLDAILRFDGHGWHHVPAGHAITGIRWHAILAVSASDVWLLGDTTVSTGSGRIVLARWDGANWRMFVTSLREWAGRLAQGRGGEVLFTATSSGLLPTGLVAAMTSDGRLTWSAIESSLGTGISDVAYVPKTGAIWASGGILTRLGGDAAVWVHGRERAIRPAPVADAD
jgi:hypothetical protein